MFCSAFKQGAQRTDQSDFSFERYPKQFIEKNNESTIDTITIYTKSTTWIMKSFHRELAQLTSNKDKVYNMHFPLRRENNTNSDIINLEFVGEHIDIGFRISKFTVPHVLSMSIEL